MLLAPVKLHVPDWWGRFGERAEPQGFRQTFLRRAFERLRDSNQQLPLR